MGMTGADLVQLDKLSKTLNDASGTVEGMRNTVDTELHNTEWTGPNANNFRAAWEDFVSTLKKLEAALIDAGKDVKTQRDRLEAVSGGAA
jgi:uncharacterized protein YukE